MRARELYEALTDHLIALRVLLEPEGASSGLLAGRLAALCAIPENRLELTERIVAAVDLERAVIAGTSVKRAGGPALAQEVADHLRALLRDVICGHLGADLPALADELLAMPEDAEDEALAEREAVAEPPAEAVGEPLAGAGAGLAGRPSSGEQVLCHPSQARKILDVFVEVGNEYGVALRELCARWVMVSRSRWTSTSKSARL